MKKNKKLLRSLIAIVLAFLLVGSIVPTMAYAEDLVDSEVKTEIEEHVSFIESMFNDLKDFIQKIIDFIKNLFNCKGNTDVPDEPTVPEVPDEPEAPNEPEVPDEPVVPEVPVEPEVPAISDTAEFLAAIKNAEDGDVIALAGGTYDIVGDNDFAQNTSLLLIEKSITIKAADPANKPILLLATSNGTGTVKKLVHGIEIKSDNVKLENLILKVAEGKTCTGNLIQISYKSNDPVEFYKDIVISGCELYGSEHSIALYGENITIENCILDESEADKQGIIIYVWSTRGTLTIKGNSLIGKDQKKHGISFYAQDSKACIIEGKINIEGNTFEDVYKPIVHEGVMTYNNVSVTIDNNVFKNYLKKPIAIDNGTFVDYNVTNNVFYMPSSVSDPFIENKTGFEVNANDNFWGTDSPVKSTIFKGAVSADRYFTDVEKTVTATW